MSNTIEYADRLNDFFVEVKAFADTTRQAPLDYMSNTLCTAYKAMFDRFCPYSIGDRVELVADIDTSNSPGWQHCTHFLIKGAEGVVMTRDYRNDKFVFGVVFDDESWIGMDGKVNFVTDKGQFSLSETRLRAINIK